MSALLDGMVRAYLDAYLDDAESPDELISGFLQAWPKRWAPLSPIARREAMLLIRERWLTAGKPLAAELTVVPPTSQRKRPGPKPKGDRDRVEAKRAELASRHLPHDEAALARAFKVTRRTIRRWISSV